MVLKNVREFIRKGKGHETEYAGATWVMELSYDDLPFHLKPCFLYLGHFPEDSEIRVKMLTQLWIAEGFIPSQNQRYGSMETMEEVAYNWLSELVERCLVQVGMQGSIRKIKTCHLHDLVRDMCLLRADEENFLHVISLRKDETSSSSKTKSRMMGNVRRLAVYMDKNVDYVVHHDGLYSRLRSLLCFGPLDWKSIRLVRSMLKDLKFLRVLKLEQNVSPNETGKMVHLRYLSMKSKDMKWLPSSIADSTCLQTLDLRETSLSLRPNVVGKMKQLRHLYLPLSTEIGKQQVSSLENLQTLQIRSNSFDWKEMAELVSLRKLTLRLSSPLENIEQILKATCNTLNHIQSLSVSNELGIDYISGLSKLGQVTSAHAMQIVLSCRNIYKLKLTHVTVELPRDPQFYPNLTKLHLYSCCFNDNQMIVLEKLPNLTKVTLDMVKFGPKRKLLIFSKGGFPRLEVLSLNMNFSNIDDWMVEEGSMPNLCELSIHHWEKIRRLPEGLRYITTFQKIKITGMSKAYRTMIQKGGEDFYKVQHVRSLVFENIRDNQGRLIQSDDEDQSDDEFLNFA